MPKFSMIGFVSGIWKWWCAYWRHPFCLFIPFVLFNAKVKENFPFTDYPMYSRPGPGPVTYYYLTDSQDNPLPVQRHCGITSPRMKRMFDSRVKSHRNDFPDLEHEERIRQVSDDVFVFLRAAADLRKRPLPAEPLRIYYGEIFQLPTGFKEDVVLLAEENPEAVPIPLADDGPDDATGDTDADFDGQPDQQEEAA